jgi:hypothetical protein
MKRGMDPALRKPSIFTKDIAVALLLFSSHTIVTSPHLD